MNKITASVVLYNTPEWQIERVLDSVTGSTLPIEVHLVDNSPAAHSLPCFTRKNVKYIKTLRNKGYGYGHNLALRSLVERSKYHLILNPDIYFDPQEIEKMIGFMDMNPSIGMMMPKVVYPDGRLQYLCKLLPTPADLILRRFAVGPLRILNDRRMECFEMRRANFEKTMDVPYLSGCCMLFRVSALKEVGFFDERFFMYLEDTDLSRRMHAQYRTVYYPEAKIVHEHARDSYRSRRMLWIHMLSAIRYFNKWGWFLDKERSRVNRKVIFENIK